MRWKVRKWRAAHPGLNQGPADLQSAALTTELCTRLLPRALESTLLYMGSTFHSPKNIAKIYCPVGHAHVHRVLAPLAQWLERWSYEP